MDDAEKETADDDAREDDVTLVRDDELAVEPADDEGAALWKEALDDERLLERRQMELRVGETGEVLGMEPYTGVAWPRNGNTPDVSTAANTATNAAATATMLTAGYLCTSD